MSRAINACLLRKWARLRNHRKAKNDVAGLTHETIHHAATKAEANGKCALLRDAVAAAVVDICNSVAYESEVVGQMTITRLRVPSRLSVLASQPKGTESNKAVRSCIRRTHGFASP